MQTWNNIKILLHLGSILEALFIFHARLLGLELVGVPQLFVLVHEVVAGEFGAAGLAREKLHVDVPRHQRLMLLSAGGRLRGHSVVVDVVLVGVVVLLLEIHGEGVDVSPLVLLVAVVALEHVAAEEALVTLARRLFASTRRRGKGEIFGQARVRNALEDDGPVAGSDVEMGRLIGRRRRTPR